MIFPVCNISSIFNQVEMRLKIILILKKFKISLILHLHIKINYTNNYKTLKKQIGK